MSPPGPRWSQAARPGSGDRTVITMAVTSPKRPRRRHLWARPEEAGERPHARDGGHDAGHAGHRIGLAEVGEEPYAVLADRQARSTDAVRSRPPVIKPRPLGQFELRRTRDPAPVVRQAATQRRREDDDQPARDMSTAWKNALAGCLRAPRPLTYEIVGSSVDPNGPATGNELYPSAATSPATPPMAYHRRPGAARRASAHGVGRGRSNP